MRELTIQEFACNTGHGQERFDAFVGGTQDITRLSYAARLALWHGLAAGGRPLEQLESLRVCVLVGWGAVFTQTPALTGVTATTRPLLCVHAAAHG